MEKRMLWLGLMLMVVGLCSSGALAQTLGPSVATLDAGQFRAGLDMSSSQTGINLKGEKTYSGSWIYYDAGVPVAASGALTGTPDKRIANEEVQNELLLANLGYGITDKLEAYLLVGVTDLGFGQEADFMGLDEGFAQSDELAYGFGVKGTFFEDGDVKFGAQLQMTWASFDGDLELDNISVSDPILGWSASVDDAPGTYEIDYYQLKIAVGPTYKLNETITFYGGPFYQMIDGNFDSERSGTCRTPETGLDYLLESVTEKESLEIGERSRYGVYFGAQINCRENLPLCVECQTNNEFYLVGASCAYEF